MGSRGQEEVKTQGALCQFVQLSCLQNPLESAELLRISAWNWEARRIEIQNAFL